jgi:predicted RND superfamily exporter protein
MKAFARLIVKRTVAWIVVVVVLGISAAAAVYANRVAQDDDILAFLPRTNPEVAGFYEASDRFGSMDVALVGIEADDVFAPDFLVRPARPDQTPQRDERPSSTRSASPASRTSPRTLEAAGSTSTTWCAISPSLTRSARRFARRCSRATTSSATSSRPMARP